ncbi:hypothetical protein JSE7799_02859 [Jannaschia seosinensis]|uniref:DUF2254 domain-containing protein n=1 Tax=Jannaschia seosinensis TaxID=313367 RepID=A0A0M7BD78_9RHOB|nr:DUF2254 domain-containing protein [Jannaschia seosinensis]CUH40129.1 hypothetical protein JSE7799_02859 [Jannaschia seosinensis]
MFLTKTLWKLREWASQVWPRVSLFSLVAILTAAVAPLISPLLPDDMQSTVGRAATMDMLSILTDSMLVASTFSLSIMVTAHHFAASQVTPRSHRLLRSDGQTQSVIATFIGAFVYALTATAIVNANFYAEADFPVIYTVTIVIIALVIGALIRWVQQLAGLGSIETTTRRVEDVAREALAARMVTPNFGGAPLRDVDGEMGWPVRAQVFGYIRHIDVRSLSARGEELDIDIALLVLPGDEVAPDDVMMRLIGRTQSPDGSVDTGLIDEMRGQVTIGALRTFDQDPLFGLQVLSEIGQRALSPGLNDPRTADDIISRQLRVLGNWDTTGADAPLPRIRARGSDMRLMVETAFDAIARDGADLVEIQMAVQRALGILAYHADPDMRQAARNVSARALARSDKTLLLEEDRKRVRDLATVDRAADRNGAAAE